MASLSRKTLNTERLFYKIGDISTIAELEPHVLRYWESEFSFLKPRKNKTGQRVYTRKDLELVLQIKNLLYKEKYTIAGVRKKYSESSKPKSSVSMQTIQSVKKRLKEISHTLSKDPVKKRASKSRTTGRKPAGQKTRKSAKNKKDSPLLF